MAKSWHEKREFLDLRDEWYARLRDEGFADIEVIDKLTRQPGPMLRGPSPGDLNRSDRRRAYIEGSAEYYRLAGHYAWTLPPGPRQHVARLHAEGLPDSKIQEILRGRYEGVEPREIRSWLRKARASIRRSASEGQD